MLEIPLVGVGQLLQRSWYKIFGVLHKLALSN